MIIMMKENDFRLEKLLLMGGIIYLWTLWYFLWSLYCGSCNQAKPNQTSTVGTDADQVAKTA